MAKRQCKFNNELQTAFKMFKSTNNPEEAHCKTCDKVINIGNGGKSSLEKHLDSQKHKSNISQASANQKMDQFVVPRNSTLDKKVAAVEITLAYHTVYHHSSFNSMNCTSKLLSTMFTDSQIASKISSAKTKTEAIVKG